MHPTHHRKRHLEPVSRFFSEFTAVTNSETDRHATWRVKEDAARLRYDRATRYNKPEACQFT